MKLFKTSLILFLLHLINVGGVHAQLPSDSNATSVLNSQFPKKNLSLLNANRMSFKLDLGVGFVGGSNSGMFTYVAPYLRYSLSPKFKLDVGGMVSQGTSSFYSSENSPLKSTSMLVFAKGNYLLTDKLTVNGSIYKSFYPNVPLKTDLSNKYSSENYGFSLGMDYKINKKMSFGAQIIMSKGNINNYLIHSQPNLFGGFPSDNSQMGIMGW